MWMRISVYEHDWFGLSRLTDHSFPWKSKSISCRTSPTNRISKTENGMQTVKEGAAGDQIMFLLQRIILLPKTSYRKQ